MTTALGEMEEAGILRRGRGKLLIANHESLEAQSCDCYRTIRAEHRRIACDAPEPTGGHWRRANPAALMSAA